MRAMMFLLVLALNDASLVPAVLRLKDGTIYRLQSPPHLSAGRFVFTTSDGQLLSLAETEVDEIRLMPPNSDARAALKPHDSHSLGAIARQERRNKGKYTLISPAPTPRPRKASAR